MATTTNFNNNDDPVIGIDLGTTYCAVGVYRNGKVEIIPNREQNTRLTPSYVAYPSNGKETYGKVAKEQSYKMPECTVYDAKRMIGRPWSDPLLQKDIQHWPFDLQNVRNLAKIKIGTKTRYPQEVSAKLLSIFCRHAEKHLEKSAGSIRKAVITVPAYFTESQRRATIEAGETAGLQVLTILNEPTAAALAYMMQRGGAEQRTALIYDLGGGTFDVSVVKISSNSIETLGVDGDTHLGGQDFDHLLAEYCAEEFKKQTGTNILEKKTEFKRPMTRLKLQCEAAKQALSSSEETFVDVQCIYKDTDLYVTLTRKKFEELIQPLLNKSMDIVAKAIKDAKGIKSKEDIDDIILVGGSTRIPMVTTMLEKFFNGKQIKTSIDPDEAVAYGAALQAVILNDISAKKVVKVEDVTPMTLGVLCVGDVFDPIIPKNHSIPCEKTKQYRTTSDNQTTVQVEIYQGENEKASKNEKLGEFEIAGIPAGPKGQETLDETMKIDANGILTVTAVVRSTKSTNALTVTDDRLRMDRDTIERLVEEVKHNNL